MMKKFLRGRKAIKKHKRKKRKRKEKLKKRKNKKGWGEEDDWNRRNI